MSQAIYGSVGHGGNNHPHDVTSVQLLLNNARYGDDPELRVDGICGPRTIAAITAYQRSHYLRHDEGIIHPGGATLRELLETSSVMYRHIVQQVHQVQKLQSSRSYPTANVDDLAPHRPKLHAALKTPEAHVASSGETGHRYTDSPLEVPRTGTTFDPLRLPDMVQKAWPALNKDGARVMTSQSMGETEGAKATWNYNLGNIKCTGPQRQSHLHTYLVGTWEYFPSKEAEIILERNKNARYATEQEIRKKIGHETGGKRMIIIAPPDIMTCFLAFKTLDDGVTGWIDYFKGKAKKRPELLDKLNAGQCAGVAHIMHEEHYYSLDEADYARSMQQHKMYLDKVLGAK